MTASTALNGMDVQSFTGCSARKLFVTFMTKRIIFMAKKNRKKEKSEKIYTISDKKLEEIKENAKKEGMEDAFILMLGLSVMTISDHIFDLYKTKGFEKCREERFTDYVLKLWDEYNQGIFSLQDVLDCLKDECGLVIELGNRNKIL
jgi:hypothetical protein